MQGTGIFFGSIFDEDNFHPHGLLSVPKNFHIDDLPHYLKHFDDTKSATPKSWADLFRSKQSIAPKQLAIEHPDKTTNNTAKTTTASFKDALQSLQIDNNVPKFCIQPRGLINPKNKCFLNVTMQSLLGCSPFLYILTQIPAENIAPTMPSLKLITQFVHEFQQVKPEEINVNTGSLHAFAPNYLYQLLKEFSHTEEDAPHVYQEDSQEFLIWLLNQIHDEILKEQKRESLAPQPHESESEADIDWQHVGKKNRTSVLLTEESTFSESVVTDIFGGKLRTTVKKTNSSKPSVSIQPFYCLHLDIENAQINDLEQALIKYGMPESVEGYIDENNSTIAASQATTLEKLPKILILHLKRFAFSMEPTSATAAQNLSQHGQIKKIHKYISFPKILHLPKSLVAANQKTAFKLLSVICHHGKNVTNGHYTCDVRQSTEQWIHYDDSEVQMIREEDVLKKTAYVLFYEQINS